MPESSEPALEGHGIRFAYGRTTVLDGVDIAVRPGEFVALAGPNGSGKSTLLRILLGVLAPGSGEVRILGESPQRLRQRWRVGYVAQDTAITGDLPATVADVVAAGRSLRRGWWRSPTAEDREAVDAALAAVDLAAQRDERLGALSGGQRQRAFIAKALAAEPHLLVLDEPISGVDADARRHFRNALVNAQARGAAVLLVSHEFGAVAEDLERLVVLARGRVTFDGPPSGLTERGVSLSVHAHDMPLWLEGLGDEGDGDSKDHLHGTGH